MSQGAHVNGPASPTGKFIDSIDPEDPEYIRNLQRPAEVKEDMKQMEGRSRVSVVLNSQAFREELEHLVQEQLRQGGPASLYALQQITDLLLPQSRGIGTSFGRSSPVIPINDIRGVETLGYSKQEKVLRCKLAACYRLIDMYGWTHGIFNHISARVSQDQEQFLVNPFGMLYAEITASTLVKVDVRGEVVDSGSTSLGISKAGFTLHSAIHQARPDIKCIIHLHTPAAVAVSATKQGLLPMSQEALICGKISYHDYHGILVDQNERDQLARNLGPFNKVMFLRNHGVVACGESIEQAFHYAFNIMAACDTQMKAMPIGIENLILVDEETQEKTFKVGNMGGGGADSSGRKWRCGELEWECFMRTLDNAGYRTGHVYKQPLMKQEKPRSTSDVELPPTSSSFTYVFDGDYEHSKYVSPIKMAMERQKQAYKAGWLTSPNTYKKTEIEEIGTTTPKKITKWVPGDETQSSTAVKVSTPNQFAPQGSNPKEFKQKQKSIRKDYYEEKVTAGPQSKILEGLSWDEAAKLKEAGDQTVVFGAASKGIIQRDHQHNAVVYRSYYAANPFENMSEDEVNAYKSEVARREHGEGPDDEPGPDGRLISSEERMQHIQHSREDMQPDTEANTTQDTNKESFVSAGTGPEAKPNSPTEPWGPSDLPFDPEQQRQEGLDRLVDVVVQAVMASALPDALRKGQLSLGGDGSVEVGTIHPSPHPSPSSVLESLLPNSASYSTVSQSFCSVSEPTFSTLTKHSDPEKTMRTSVKTKTVRVDDMAENADWEQSPEMATVELEPLKLFQGKPGDGVMKISFTIQSKVTRRRSKGPMKHWPIENVTITQSPPKVTIVHPEDRKALKEQQNVIIAYPLEGQGKSSTPPTPPMIKDAQGTKRHASRVPHVVNPQQGASSVQHTGHAHQYQQNPARRSHTAAGRRQAGGKLGRLRKKARWTRRGLTHPLSPVKEEYLELVEGEDTLEALLASQNVEISSDESLEDLLLMTDNYKENLFPSHLHQPPASEAAVPEPNKAAPIATLEDFDESSTVPVHNSLELEQESKTPQKLVDCTVQETISLSSAPDLSQEPVSHTEAGIALKSSPAEDEDVSQAMVEQKDLQEDESVSQTAVEQKDLQEDESVPQTTVEQKDLQDEIKFADEEFKVEETSNMEETSNTIADASDGDVAPRKHEDGQTVTSQTEVYEDKLSSGSDQKIIDHTDHGIHEPPSQNPLELLSDSKTDLKSDGDQGSAIAEATEPQSPNSSASTEPGRAVVYAPLASMEESLECDTLPTAETQLENKQESIPLENKQESIPIENKQESIPIENKRRRAPSLHRSASLETSPIITSPPFDSFPSDPVYRELHRVRSFGDELDETVGPVVRREKKGQWKLRRTMSTGTGMSEFRNVAVIDAVLHTVTIDPAKMGQPVSSYLASAQGEKQSASDGGKTRWSLMDTVSKSLEELDEDVMVKEGAKIFGRSLEVRIHDKQLLPEDLQALESPTTRRSSLKHIFDNPEKADELPEKGGKIYKDDVVIVTKSENPVTKSEKRNVKPETPSTKSENRSTSPRAKEYSAISPQDRKEIMDAEEGPLVTSSPKLGRRRREGSFKKYQSRMGKSEETLLEVAPLTPEKAGKPATRSKSFPKNYGVNKNWPENLFRDHPSLIMPDGGDQNARETTQSTSRLDEGSHRNRHSKKGPRETLIGTSNHAVSESRLNQLRREKQRSKELLQRQRSKDIETNSVHSDRSDSPAKREIRKEEEHYKVHRWLLQQHQDEPPSEEKPKRRRRRGSEGENEPAKASDVVVENYNSLTLNRRDRRRRKEQASANTERSVDKQEREEYDRREKVLTETKRSAYRQDSKEYESDDRDRRRRRREQDRSEKNTRKLDVEAQQKDIKSDLERILADQDRGAPRPVSESQENQYHKEHDRRSKREQTSPETERYSRDNGRDRERTERQRRRDVDRAQYPDEERKEDYSSRREEQQGRRRYEQTSEDEGRKNRQHVSENVEEDTDRRRKRRNERGSLQSVDESSRQHRDERLEHEEQDRRRREHQSETGRSTRRRDDYEEPQEEDRRRGQTSSDDHKGRRRQNYQDQEDVRRSRDAISSDSFRGRRQDHEEQKDRDSRRDKLSEVDKGSRSRLDTEVQDVEERDRRRRRRTSVESERSSSRQAGIADRDSRRDKLSEVDQGSMSRQDTEVQDVEERDRRRRRRPSEESERSSSRQASEEPVEQSSRRRRRDRLSERKTEGRQEREQLPEDYQKRREKPSDFEKGEREEYTKDRDVESENVARQDSELRAEEERHRRKRRDRTTAEHESNIRQSEDYSAERNRKYGFSNESGRSGEHEQFSKSSGRRHRLEKQDSNDVELYGEREMQRSTSTQDNAAEDGNPEREENQPDKARDSFTPHDHEDREHHSEPMPQSPASGGFEMDGSHAEEFPPPPEDLLAVSDDIAVSTKQSNNTQQPKADESTTSDVPFVDDDDVEYKPPRMSKPRVDSDIDEDASVKQSTFLSSFKEPVQVSQTVGDDFPALSNKPESHHSQASLTADRAGVGVIPIVAGNLDIITYSDDEAPRVRTLNRYENQETVHDDEQQTSRGRRSEGRRNRIDGGRDADSVHTGSEQDLPTNQNFERNKPAERQTSVEKQALTRETQSRGDNLGDMDIMNFDEEPPWARRTPHQPRKNIDSDGEPGLAERPRSEGRVRGRRDGGAPRPASEDMWRRGRNFDDENTHTPPPEIRVLAASQDSLDRPDFAPPLPPKLRKSMELLSEFDDEPRRVGSRDFLNKTEGNRVPELPPKKNKMKLSCVGADDMEASERKSEEKRKKKKDKEHSAAKERNKLPPPAFPPQAPKENKDPASGGLLQVPRVESAYGIRRDDINEKYGQHSPQISRKSFTPNTSAVFDETASVPSTPKPIRKLSTSNANIGEKRVRSVSFNDGYTPTMTRRDSLNSVVSTEHTYGRSRSYSAASETSVASNPLMYEPWRAKAGALHPSHNHSKPRRSRSHSELGYSASGSRRHRSRTPDSSRMYQPRSGRQRASLPDAPLRPAAPHTSKSHDSSSILAADESFSDVFSHGYASEAIPQPVKRTESERKPERNPELIKELERKGIGRSKSDRRAGGEGDGDKPGSPSKSDPMDSASGGETLEERSSKEGSPTKEAPHSPTKEKKKKKKFRMPSFSKTKKKESKESAI